MLPRPIKALAPLCSSKSILRLGIVVLLACAMGAVTRALHKSLRGECVSGRVTDSQGTPLAGAEIRAFPRPLSHPAVEAPIAPKDSREHRTVTSPDGRYRLTNLTAGFSPARDLGWIQQEYDLRAEAVGYKSQTVWVHFEKGSLTDVNFSLDRGTDTAPTVR